MPDVTDNLPLLQRTTCPNCWFKFEPALILWIASHPSLRGDPRLGTDAFRRFLPSRFTAGGGALDECGSECTQLACPRCHLPVPRLCVELAPWFVSIFGAPGSGKSYLLSTMTWALRRHLPDWFRVSFTDTDSSANQMLAASEEPLFYNPHPESSVPLGELVRKTQESGDPYNTARFGNTEVQYPRPYMFTIRPLPGHPLVEKIPQPGRVLCLYDNAGESFQAGKDNTANPVTRHLSESSLLLFLFDPLQYQPFRNQLGAAGLLTASDFRLGQTNRQDLILTEAANRVRRFAGLSDSAKIDRHLFVIVTKQDVWTSMVPEFQSREPIFAPRKDGVSRLLNLDRLEEISRAIRQMLVRLTPEIVSAAEGFARSVTYLGASALGTAPHKIEETGQWAIRPKDVQPRGVEIPIIYGLQQEIKGFIPVGRKSTG